LEEEIDPIDVKVVQRDGILIKLGKAAT